MKIMIPEITLVMIKMNKIKKKIKISKIIMKMKITIRRIKKSIRN